MKRTALLSAVATGAFCGPFALIVDTLSDGLGALEILAAGAISGFLGSLFAHFILWKKS
ncbi:hypothetical protein [Parasulfitobacter algicola]|uniref:Uncharacterized protein n=1 Tax=Parasulfitobacter algicola TaxID=2614809 RepID=A0ABX2IR37_9RHOB|nr:hypothetical protein [Sulfitobacter algicola]NSX55338.1 hypothetical protein [Sulfitobacter algicola]